MKIPFQTSRSVFFFVLDVPRPTVIKNMNMNLNDAAVHTEIKGEQYAAFAFSTSTLWVFHLIL